MMAPSPEVRVTVAHGDVGASARGYLATKVAQSMTAAPGPILSADATVSTSSNPAHERPVTVKATLDVNGHAVRAQVTADEVREAADLLADRLRHGLEILAERRLERRHRHADPTAGAWRHGMLPPQRPPYHPRPPEERQIVRRKTFAAPAITPEEAVEEMALLDHDFHLFVEAWTGSDAMVERLDDGRVAVAIVGRPLPELDPPDLEVHSAEVPTMELAEAVRALEDGGLDRLFFVEAAMRRGVVVYRRYDGHYGLITPET